MYDICILMDVIALLGGSDPKRNVEASRFCGRQQEETCICYSGLAVSVVMLSQQIVAQSSSDELKSLRHRNHKANLRLHVRLATGREWISHALNSERAMVEWTHCISDLGTKSKWSVQFAFSNLSAATALVGQSLKPFNLLRFFSCSAALSLLKIFLFSHSTLRISQINSSVVYHPAYLWVSPIYKLKVFHLPLVPRYTCSLRFNEKNCAHSSHSALAFPFGSWQYDQFERFIIFSTLTNDLSILFALPSSFC